VRRWLTVKPSRTVPSLNIALMLLSPVSGWYGVIMRRVATNCRFVGMISRTMSGLIGIPRSSVQRQP
jgi:hypothetical protein